ncbi:MAG: hypothetical protein V9H69_16655 [Anaerolineae bacterium]
MLRTFAYAAGALGRDDYRQIAQRNAAFILRALMTSDSSVAPSPILKAGEPRSGTLRTSQPPHEQKPLTAHRSPIAAHRLHRSWAPASLTGGEPQARLNAYLEDYASVADGLVELYQLTFELRWLEAARGLVETMLERFWDPRQGGFFQTSHDHEGLIARPKEVRGQRHPFGQLGRSGCVAAAARLDRRRALPHPRRGNPAVAARRHGPPAAGLRPPALRAGALP